LDHGRDGIAGSFVCGRQRDAEVADLGLVAVVVDELATADREREAAFCSATIDRDRGLPAWAEQESFIAKAIEAVQGWDSNGGMQRLKDQRRIRELEQQNAELRAGRRG
jgi:hypothetical protein